ncbi:MAG: PadR family transcriptional regulator [Thermoplasmata archaeon]
MVKRDIDECVSMPIDAKTILLQGLKKTDVLLFLYRNGVDRYPTYTSFIKAGLENNSYCFYAYDKQDHKWHPELVFKKYIDSQQFQPLPLEAESDPIQTLDEGLKVFFDRAKANRNISRVLIDFGSTINTRNESNVISYMQEIIKKNKTLPYISINALDISSLSYDGISNVVKLHEKVAVFTPQDVGMMLNFSGQRKFKEVSIEPVSIERVEQFVKGNLEAIVLHILQDQNLCGYDVIKTISQRYNVFLSQGTLYPLLYLLAKQGLLEVKQETKAKVYSPTENGRKIIQDRISEFRKVQEYMLNLLKEHT